MTRRKPYTSVVKQNQVRPAHVKGMGDVVFKGFQCLNPDCREYLFVRKSEIGPDFCFQCGACKAELKAGGETKFFDYELVHRVKKGVIQRGGFVILHDDYLDEAQEFKYCILCYALKPLGFFDKHGSRASGRQGECNLCKTIYNGIKNQTRITDQHREAAQRRRLYKLLAGEASKLESQKVFQRFGGKCFNCNKDVGAENGEAFHLDHTLPARFLWPITTETATLLCGSCNNNKHDKWPSEYYKPVQLKRLAVLTGIEYGTLAGPSQLNDKAVAEILKDVDGFLVEWIKYPDDIKKVRRLIQERQKLDIFEHARNVPGFLRES